jgi:protein SCO1/2
VQLTMTARFASTVLLALASLGARADTTASAFRLPQWPAQAGTPDFHLTDTHGRARALADFKGFVTVVYFGFVSCPDICPATLGKLALVGHQLGRSADRLEVLFVTLDPEHDTPAQLDAYVKATGLRSTALTGTPDRVNQAAQAFSVQHARIVSNGVATIDHSGGLFIIDTAGHLRLVAPVSVSVDDLAHDLRILAAQPLS